MRRLKYIFIKLRTLQLGNMLKIARKINKLTKKSVLFILIDMILSAFKYGCGYMDYFEFEFYLLNDKERRTYITGSINSEIVAKYNDKDYFYIFDNKAEFNSRFKEFMGRDYLLLNKDNFPEFRKFVEGKERFIVKPNDNSCGIGVEVINVKDIADFKALHERLINNDQALAEDFIVQAEAMNELYAASVNTFRVISFLKDDEVHVLKVILKIGNGGLVDNFSNGGMYTFVNEEGFIYVPAIDERGNIFEVHPISNTKIVGFKVPQYSEICELVKKMGKVIPQMPYIGWDIAVTDKGPVVVEGNNFSGIFQVKPSISGIKTGDLPNFRRYMDI